MPPRKRAPSGPTPVESIRHGEERRRNIPTSDASEFVTPDVEERRQILLERDTALDPQLVWRGKYGAESADDVEAAETLAADAPPIYIQEKIDPRVLIENLRRTAVRPEDEPELALFETFDDLGELDRLDFYRHDTSWTNRMILGDSLQVMGSLAEREELRGKVQMVYVDPPYGIKFGSNWQASARRRDVKDGRLEDAAREAEQIKAFRDTWELGIHSYLSYLRDRLLVARELLTESGSCFVQIGDENVHLVRSLMDEVFGSENFISQIAFRTTTGQTSDFVPGVADYVLWFAKDRERAKFRPAYVGRNVRDDANYRYVVETDGVRALSGDELREVDRLFARGARICRANPLTSQTVRVGQTTVFPVDVGGSTYRPRSGGWKTNETGMAKLKAADRLQPLGRTLTFTRLFADFPYQRVASVWDDTRQSGFGDAKTYVVQTATKVIERCMLMCTDPGDLVLDPTCGSGTTAYVAEQWGRRWITVDTSRVALALARQRLMGAKYPYYLLADSAAGRKKEREVAGVVSTSSLASLASGSTTEVGGRAASASERVETSAPRGDIRRGFVYERVPHVTLKSIANNPDIVEGMTRDEIDAAIKRHADTELLYDRPYEDKGVVRVSGPFTVESLSPHRSLAFSGDTDEHESTSEQAVQPDAATYEQSILDNLLRAGVQNGRKSERIELDAIEAYPGTFVQAVGVSTTQVVEPDASAASEDVETTGVSTGSTSGTRVGIAIGPQYGTVDQKFAAAAVKEAVAAGDIDLLCLLGFAFDASTSGVTEADGVTVDSTADGFASVAGERSFGRIKLLFVRMNVDLLMGEDLKKTGAGNLFTVFGEPDIDVRRTDDGQVQVDLNGVDVYDPTTGEVRSDDTGRIALWMVDSDYDGDSFFVRHCYFTGGGDPYKRLKTALKADIDADAWSTLYGTTSAPFAAPSTGRIAVKVINDYGDEVMKVFDVEES